MQGFDYGTPSYGISTRVAGEFDAVIASTREALAAEGFGVLTEIDVTATMKKKLDEDLPRYTILGGCNPSLALQAIQAEPGIGLLLPCNVVVAEGADGKVAVSAVDPSALFEVVGRPDIADVAHEVKARLERVIQSLG